MHTYISSHMYAWWLPKPSMLWNIKDHYIMLSSCFIPRYEGILYPGLDNKRCPFSVYVIQEEAGKYKVPHFIPFCMGLIQPPCSCLCWETEEKNTVTEPFLLNVQRWLAHPKPLGQHPTKTIPIHVDVCEIIWVGIEQFSYYHVGSTRPYSLYM